MPRRTLKPRSESGIDVLLREDRLFRPATAFRRQANAKDPSIYRKAARDPEAFWASCARDLVWHRPWKTVLTWNPPHARWFAGGQLNASVNCLDRHLGSAVRNKAAILWEPVFQVSAPRACHVRAFVEGQTDCAAGAADVPPWPPFSITAQTTIEGAVYGP